MAKTPLMRQYHEIKKSHPDSVLLFRVGDFFETFENDAKVASKVLGITLTKRSNGAAGDVPLAGFPHHAIDTYLPKLVRAGYRVAVCEQIEDPKMAKGIVKREVTEVVTPGVAMSEKLLDHKKNNYLMSIFLSKNNAGISFCDISTGEFKVYEVPLSHISEQIGLINPAEVILAKSQYFELEKLIFKINADARLTKIEDWLFEYDYSYELLTSHFKTVNLKGFGIEDFTGGISAAGAVLNYLQETQKVNLFHLNKITKYNPSDFMFLDFSTKRNLEITFHMQSGNKEGSLISILDKTETPMGGRLLKNWISAPLRKVDEIQKRQSCVSVLFDADSLSDSLKKELKEIGDLERLISKICTGRANPRELVQLKLSLKKIPLIKQLLENISNEYISDITLRLNELENVVEKIETAIDDAPSLNLIDGGIIREGYNEELDQLRSLSGNAKNWIANLQKSERERTGISSLKVGYNKVFGYYIEISNAHKDKVPQEYIRKQTLVNGERFITQDLKIYEEKVLNAHENIIKLETQLFAEVRNYVSNFTKEIQQNASLIANLDCFLSLSVSAKMYNYVKPVISNSNKIKIKKGRHPVVENILPPGEKFTPNDTLLSNDENQIILLTGPNMAGKSVYLRQIGLIVLLAQIGSYVPAEYAEIGVVDRIYTRVGASDNITSGESTFLVEMQEAANILNNATNKSLVLLDEIGRGTSTFDGISIAWAITEYLHENPRVAAKTLFATHYHELNEMASIFPRIKNFKVEVREYDDKVIFLHRVTPGGADHSYGIQVAQMAGLPDFVTKKAKEILTNLESKELTPFEVKKAKIAKFKAEDINQINLFEFKDDEIRTEINEIEIDKLTPIDALNRLNELKEKVKSK